MRRRTWSRLLSLVGLLALTGCWDNMYPTQNFHPECADWEPNALLPVFCQTDDLAVTWHALVPLTAAERNLIDAAVESNFEPTDLRVTQVSNPVVSAQDETDIIFERGFIASGADGLTWCEDALTWQQCDQHYVRFRTGSTLNMGVVCHEFGHAVGLTHGAQASPATSNTEPALGCMRTPTAPNVTLGSHNISMINGTY